MVISKSKYLKLLRCPKILWLEKNLSEEIQKEEHTLNLYNPSKDIEELSQKLFEGKNSAVYVDGKYDFEKMTQNTQYYINSGEKVIYKATFCLDKTYFVVDIIKKVKNGYMLYLVKPSKNLKKNFLQEMAYISYVLKKVGISIYRYIVVTINKDYIKHGDIEPKKYFKLNYVGTDIKEFESKVDDRLNMYYRIMRSKEEPTDCFDTQCITYGCNFLEHCSRHLPKPNIFDIYALGNKMELYSKKIWSFQDVVDNTIPLNAIQYRQVDYTLNNKGIFVDKPLLDSFLDNVTYPLYFLDFETTMYDLPYYEGTSPSDMIPFQYSLHYINKKGGKLYHKEFLADERSDPRPSLAKQLFEDIPSECKIMAYNASFEKKIIQTLGKLYPEYAEKAEQLSKNFVDLIEPFEKGYVYNKDMGGSFSLKSVLPALFPGNPELDYSKLEGIHNGQDARVVFPTLRFMSPEERQKERESLLRYCYLDTYAMVKILEKLYLLSDENKL